MADVLPLRSIRLSDEHWASLEALAHAHGLSGRSEMVRVLIDGAARFLDPMPTPGQISALMDRLTEAVRDPRFQ
jgi:hypothetical protein